MTSLIEITDLYLNQTHEQLELIAAAIQQGDPASVTRHAHSSAGASGVCGIVVMEPLFRELEALGKSAQLEAAPPVFEALCKSYALVKDFLLRCRHQMPLS